MPHPFLQRGSRQLREQLFEEEQVQSFVFEGKNQVGPERVGGLVARREDAPPGHAVLPALGADQGHVTRQRDGQLQGLDHGPVAYQGTRLERRAAVKNSYGS